MIRLSNTLSLIFFVIVFGGCKQDSDREISIVWKGEQAVALTIPASVLPGLQEVSTANELQIRIQHSPEGMLGNFSRTGDKILFEPLIPLTRGRGYDLYFKTNLIGTIDIPAADSSQAASLHAVYPTHDTLPENLLKIYLQFSAPMQEGRAVQNIFLLNEHNDTLPDVFLDLQPELWNEERTILTVWLDPGRIKRDLIPNKKMGNPLQSGHHYTILVARTFKDLQGLPLSKPFSKKFIITARDDQSPQPATWKLHLPSSGTRTPLIVNFGEPLDYFLLKETVRVVDAAGKTVACNIVINKNETALQMSPVQPWQPGNYRLLVESYLEDLAGNNLNRPFDRDVLLQKETAREDRFKRGFIIR